MKSLSGAQLAPPLVVFQMPPPTLPAQSVLGSVGCTTMERMRPPMLPGPSQVQPPGCIPATLGSPIDRPRLSESFGESERLPSHAPLSTGMLFAYSKASTRAPGGM